MRISSRKPLLKTMAHCLEIVQFTSMLREELGQGRIFIDYLRNTYAQTVVAPYSIRAYNGAPVATPIEWEELSKIKSSQQYNIKNIFKRLAQKKEIWKNFDLKQRINV